MSRKPPKGIRVVILAHEMCERKQLIQQLQFRTLNVYF
jgi:hypothetical protein